MATRRENTTNPNQAHAVRCVTGEEGFLRRILPRLYGYVGTLHDINIYMSFFFFFFKLIVYASDCAFFILCIRDMDKICLRKRYVPYGLYVSKRALKKKKNLKIIINNNNNNKQGKGAGMTGVS